MNTRFLLQIYRGTYECTRLTVNLHVNCTVCMETTESKAICTLLTENKAICTLLTGVIFLLLIQGCVSLMHICMT